MRSSGAASVYAIHIIPGITPSFSLSYKQPNKTQPIYEGSDKFS